MLCFVTGSVAHVFILAFLHFGLLDVIGRVPENPVGSCGAFVMFSDPLNPDSKARRLCGIKFCAPKGFATIYVVFILAMPRQGPSGAPP